MGREGQGNLDGVGFIEMEWPKIFINFFRTFHFLKNVDLCGFLLIKTEERGKEILWGEGKTGRNSWALGRSISTRFWRFL